jgi:malate dehydrogenase
MCELYKKKGLNPKKIVGVTTLDCVRANKFVAEKMGVDPSEVAIPVIGGHAGATIMPVFSQDPVGAKLASSDVESLDKRVQDAGTEVVNAKDGKGSATLSMAYAGARLGKAILKGLNGEPATECAYVVSDGVSELPYFTTKVTFGPGGIEKVHPIGALNEYEKKRLAEAEKQLKSEIDTGLNYAMKI